MHCGNLLQNKVHYFFIALALAAGVLKADVQGPAARTDQTTNINPLPLKSGVVRQDAASRAMLQKAQRIIAAYHKGQPQATNLLRVIYFVPEGGHPLPNDEARLDRIVTDVSDFYRDAFLRFGIQTAGLPLERKDGKLVVRLVRGKLPASAYHYESSDRTAQEIALDLKGTLDIEREHLLVFYALCRKTNEGRYVFDTPYYGSGSQRGGMCHAADCELLDPLLLADTNQTMVFTEHYYPQNDGGQIQFHTGGHKSKHLGREGTGVADRGRRRSQSQFLGHLGRASGASLKKALNRQGFGPR